MAKSLSNPQHALALLFLFLTEMWERYGFYIVQGLLVLYLSQFFHFSDDDSYTLLGLFTALVYLSPIVGGWLADKFLGFKLSVFWGGFFLIVGYFFLALPSTALFFYPGLATIVLGTGLLKPAISSLLGMQYDFNDSRREGAFTIFYIGINVGIFLAGISSGYIREYFGWHVSFAVASMGLVLGMAIFSFGLRYLIFPETYKQSTEISLQIPFFFGCLLMIFLISHLLTIYSLIHWLLPTTGVLILIFLMRLAKAQSAFYRERLTALNVLIISSVVYWMLYMQMFFSANLFINRLVDKNFMGFHLSTTLFYASESVFIILLGPWFAKMWYALTKKKKNPASLDKFIIAILSAGGGFIVLGISIFFVDAHGLVPPLWIVAAYLLITIGELLISPIGLSAVTVLAPPRMTGMMMGIWLGAVGFGAAFAGWIAELADIPSAAFSVSQKLLIYQHAFFYYAGFALLSAMILWLWAGMMPGIKMQ